MCEGLHTVDSLSLSRARVRARACASSCSDRSPVRDNARTHLSATQRNIAGVVQAGMPKRSSVAETVAYGRWDWLVKRGPEEKETLAVLPARKVSEWPAYLAYPPTWDVVVWDGTAGMWLHAV